MRILIFHGYLLEGTGSNVYNANLAAALVRQGHEVHLFCQDRHPGQQRFVDAVGDWDAGRLRVHTLHERVRCTTYRPDIGPILPVYVQDRYEGIEARTFGECTDPELERYLEANVAAVREVAAQIEPELALANHLVMGPVILARALEGTVPYAVKIHGSALEYTVKPERDRFLAVAREGLAEARTVLVGSLHTAESLWDTLDDPDLPRRTRLGPPGVDVELFRPLAEHGGATARELVDGLARRLGDGAHAGAGAGAAGANAGATGSPSAFSRDQQEAAAALDRVDLARDRLVAFVGKLIVSKGPDLLVGAWPLVCDRVPDARLLVVGFGSYRVTLERLIGALGSGDIDLARELARRGRELEQDAPARLGLASAAPLRYLLAFFDSLDDAGLKRYLDAASGLRERVLLSGRLDHDELSSLLPACEAVVVPSTFPESFGMIAAEAAACGALPVSAEHSGLAEVSAALRRNVPVQAAEWLSFVVDKHAVPALASCLIGWLQADESVRAETRHGLVRTAREQFSWEGVAANVIAAARGDLDRLRSPAAQLS
jgi:glycosyltransferase involved in cell wall biosynthesis